MEADFRAMRDIVDGAALSAEGRSTALWWFDQLPWPYRELGRTYDNRYLDEIRRLVQLMLKALTEKDTPGVVGDILSRLLAMHERLGIPQLGLKAPAPAKRPPPRKAP
jgi:hypothetical protein